jgi:hypoxanthine phosphoribosyltransferase
MRKKNNVKQLNADIFSRLIEIFNEKSWEIENDESNEVSLFNRFSSTLSELTYEQQILVLELTERFTRIKFDEYLIFIKEMLENFVNDNDISEINNIFIGPLISPEDFGESKSSTMIQYVIRGIIQNVQELAFKRINYTQGLEVKSDHINTDNSILFLVDDFVGTGETASAAVNYLVDEKSIDKNKIVILSIAALNEGKIYISNLGVQIYTARVFNKGISDFYPTEIVDEKITLMKTIEKKIKVHRNERLGYRGSEALITLIRTPNNTFPVFWKEKKNRIAPFPR